MARTRIAAVAGVAMVVLAVLALRGLTHERARRRPDVVLISLDTVRADRVSALYPLAHQTTPNLERAGGVRFRNCWSHAPYTAASHASLLSGRYRSAIHYGVSPRYFNASGAVLPEILRDHGYQTVAITSGGFMGKRWGVGRGFRHFEETKNWDHGDEVGKTRAWLARWHAKSRRPRSAPLFLFVHTFLAHQPYVSERFGTTLSDRYDGDIHEADGLIGMVWDALQAAAKERGRDLVMVVVADHGEEMGDHGHFGLHAHNLFGELLHVPCVVAGTGIAPRTVDARVGLIDVAPTILDRVGLPIPADVDGVSLVPLIEARPWPHDGRIMFAARPQSPDIMGYRALGDDGSYIEDIGKPVAYYAPSDPTEQKNAWDPANPAARRLADATLAFRRRWQAPAAPEPTYDPATRAKLEALGYVLQGDAPTGKPVSEPPPRASR